MKERIKMKKAFVLSIVWCISTTGAWGATNNSQYPPTFIWVDVCSNGLGDEVNESPFPRMEPDVFDIGVDIGADGTVDRWLSQEKTAYLAQGNANSIAPGNWCHFIFLLDDQAEKQAKLVIVDRSAEYYMAINALRLNHADGIRVQNEIPNGFFEEGLNHWTVLETNVPNQDDLIIDNDGTYSMYSSKFFCTRTDPTGSDNSETAVIESEIFTLRPPSSFVYGAVSGGASEMFNLPEASGSDNASGVFLDVGNETEQPNGVYDEGHDVPLIGFFGGTASSVRNQMHPVFFDTTGLEGLPCSVVAIDNSVVFHVGLDSFRMNWDIDIIGNGGFDEIPTPEDNPAISDWYTENSAIEYLEHPSGKIPGWNVEKPEGTLDSVWYFDKCIHGSQFSGRTYVGTGGFSEADRVSMDIKIFSDVFTITPISNPASSVFVQFVSAQGSARQRYTPDGSSMERGLVQLWVDVNGNGEFNDTADYTYTEIHQNMGHNMNNSNLDVWQYPEYRWYIQPEHQGKQAKIYVEDTLGPQRGSYGWMCVDDFYLWDGFEARLLFPNSDFEMGSLENWVAEYDINGGQLGSVGSGWLSGNPEAWESGLVDHQAMNNRHSMADGMFAADTGADEAGVGGDAGTGTLTSIAFTLPIAPVNVIDWALF